MTQINSAEQSSTHLSPTDSEGRVIPDLLDSPEALESYLADVKRRRELHREQRRRAYWQSAILRLREELEAARAEQDEVISTEVAGVLTSFQKALAAATSVAEFATEDVTNLSRAAEQKAETAPTHTLDEAGTQQSLTSSNGLRTKGTQAKLDSPTLKKSAPIAPPPADEAARAELAARCQDLRERIKAHLPQEGGDLTHALKARALFCEGQSLALDLDTPVAAKQKLTDPLDDLAASPASWSQGYPFSLRQQDAKIWRDLTALYGPCAEASEALDWYSGHEQEVPEDARVDVLNTISAVQQRLYRSPDGTGRRDDAVHDMYRCIRTLSQNTGFIRALSPSVGEAELSDLAARCNPLLAEVQAEVEENRARIEREAVKNEAVAAVVAWEEALEGRTVTEDSIDDDRKTLCGLLDGCLAAGVSPTNIKVRSAILDTAPVLLEGLPKYAKFLDAVNTERTKRSLEAVEIAPPQEKVGDNDFSRMVRSLVDFTNKKTIVLLGGKSRPQVAEDLSELLQCDVAWHDSDSGDKFAKFASKLKKADIVLLLKNFASHEIFYGSKDAMAADGKHFVVLPSGYGVRQVVFQLNEYAAKSSAAREKVTA